MQDMTMTVMVIVTVMQQVIVRVIPMGLAQLAELMVTVIVQKALMAWQVVTVMELNAQLVMRKFQVLKVMFGTVIALVMAQRLRGVAQVAMVTALSKTSLLW